MAQQAIQPPRPPKPGAPQLPRSAAAASRILNEAGHHFELPQPTWDFLRGQLEQGSSAKEVAEQVGLLPMAIEALVKAGS